ncbi:Universal stress protein family protein [Candidatus Nitrosocosmicus oleophilus]|uniref:Universal stress protein family protein n=1 Tax=Candidatus Nitrosocosmicus oleophilus TaxID=1353260 RepID=A0A654M3H1_9ARCH|nr:universal stress protein [Candidatus Nitrosocosmicus oleophilus]ALI37091.1 Universal stress protein family protein [Candidatus Nitrosocosmicus oleophilus]
MISSILVTDDGTESSDKAIEKASELAKQMNVLLILLHVIDDIGMPRTLVLGNDKPAIEVARVTIGKAIEKGWRQRAKTIIDKLEKEEKIPNVRSHCVWGVASEEILKFAERNKIDMIVMGPGKRLKGFSKIGALGSVTRKVSELANCPVLIVH